jgi:predicted acetyltransferase
MRYLWGDERQKVLPSIFDEWRRQRPGSINRSDGRWEAILLDRPFDRRGASAAFYVVHEDERGAPDGYVSYRIKGGDDDGDNTVILREVVAVDPHVEAALYRFVFDLDLTDRFVLRIEPVDSQVPWRLTDKRAYHSSGLWDFLWLRIMDTPGALAARRYATNDTLVLDIADPFRPDGAAAGRFRLEGGPDGATCVPEQSAAVDITLSVEALGSAYLGGVRWSTLAAAGRASGTTEVLKRADAMFTSAPLPFCNTGF